METFSHCNTRQHTRLFLPTVTIDALSSFQQHTLMNHTLMNYHNSVLWAQHNRLLSSTSTTARRDQIDTLLEQGSIQEAHTVMEQAVSSINDDDNWIKEVWTQIFDAWIDYQQTVLDSYYNRFSSKTTTLSPEQLHFLKEIVHSAESAHNLLEQMEPLLGARNVWIDTKNPLDHDGVEYHGKIAEAATKASYSAAAAAAVTPKKAADVDLTRRCDAVLTAWARTVRACHKGQVERNWLRAIPQRAQFLLERMEASFEAPSTAATSTTVKPTLDSYNRVLEAWAYSKEHLRAASAERIFHKITSSKPGTAAANVHPNGESYRLIIWAWALSREHRAAFTATGHLMKMLRKLERGSENDTYLEMEGDGVEPTIDDYHVVLKAWTRSE